jgi:hypothetical protein
MAAVERHGLRPFRTADGQEIQRRCASPAHLTGVFEESAATVQPAKLARGLRRVALEHGVRIYEHSAMRDVVDGERPTVRTEAGSIRANKVVLAMNAWGVRFPELRKAMVVVSSDIIVTEPLPERLREIGCTTGVGISDSRMLVHCHRDHRRRIAFGKGGGRPLGFRSSVGQAFERISLRELPSTLVRVHVSELSRRSLSLDMDQAHRSVEERDALVQTSGRPRALRDRFFGKRHRTSGGGTNSRFPRPRSEDEWSLAASCDPRPGLPARADPLLRRQAIQEAVRRRDQAEDEGRKPAAIVRAVAALAPTGLSPVKKKSA